MAKAAADRPLTSDDLYGLLERRCEGEAWALFGQVGDATGGRHQRTADALAMSLWPSRGLELHGFELKVSRSDLVRELRDPAKSAPIQKYCDRWWLVLADEKMLAAGELPPTWGVLSAKGKKLVQVVEAPKLAAEPVDRRFLAALLRAVRRAAVPQASYDALKARIGEEAEARALQLANDEARALHSELSRKLTEANREIESMKHTIERFQKASGIDLTHSWSAGNIGDAVKLLTDLHVPGHKDMALRGVREAAKHLERNAADVGKLASLLEQALSPPKTDNYEKEDTIPCLTHK